MFTQMLGKLTNKTTTPQNQAPVSASKATVAETIFLPPFRSIDDFINNKEWNIPTFSDLNRLNHRIINNLIYYQRNYFALGIALMFLIG
jgi:hypothetical protein